MNLQTLLNKVATGCPIVIFGIDDVAICNVLTKESIPIDLYEYGICNITVGVRDMKHNTYAMYITIAK